MLGKIFNMTLKKSKHVRSGYSALAESLFYGFTCKISKNFAFHRNQCKLKFVFYVKTDVSPLSTCMSNICKQEL